MTERELQTAVITIARSTGWRLAHFRPGKTAGGRWATQMSGDVGYPDLTMVRPPRMVFAELKSETGTMGPGQLSWLTALAGCPQVEVYLWRPEHLEKIATLLSRKWWRWTPPAGDPDNGRISEGE